jgi:hypothetical protein
MDVPCAGVQLLSCCGFRNSGILTAMASEKQRQTNEAAERPDEQWHKTFAEWLDTALRQRGRSVQALARALEIDPSKVSKMRRYPGRRPSAYEIPLIEQYFGEKAPDRITPDALDFAPVLGAASGRLVPPGIVVRVRGVAEPGVYSEPGQREPRRSFLAFPEDTGGIFALEMQGSSLEGIEPRAPNGSTLVCIDSAKIGLNIEPGRLYIIERTGAGGLIELSARRAQVFPDHIEFRCDDKRYPAITVPLPIEASQDVKVRGTVWRVIHEVSDLSHLIR